MMEFLRALAPHHAQDKSRAMAVVPPRYAVDGAFDNPLPAIASEPGPRELDAVQTSRAVRGPENRSRTANLVEGPLRSSNTVRDATPRERVNVEPDRQAASVLVESSSMLEVLPPSMRPGPAPMPDRSDAGGQYLHRPARSTNTPTDTTVRPLTVVLPRPGQERGHQGPLSRHAMLARAVAPSDQRPIVHVTIDRIDVRAPAAPERTPRPRSRSASATGSLTEYLRARQPKRQGGAS